MTGASSSHSVQTFLVPVKEFLYALFDFDAMLPTKGVEFGDIDELAHGAIGFGGVEGDFALEAYGLDNQFREFSDGEFLASAHIDVAVADFAQRGDVATTAGTVVAVNSSIGAGTEMN